MAKEPAQNQPLNLEAALVKKAQAGDNAAFDKLVDVYWSAIYRMVYYRVQTSMDAEDLAQEVFFKAYRGLDGLQEPGRFKPWLYSIAGNLVTDYYRKKGVRSIVGNLGDEEPAPANPGHQTGKGEQMVFKKQFWDAVNRFLSGLPHGEQEVFRLRFLDQLNIREVAEVSGRSESAVKTQLYRALGKLRGSPGLLNALRGEA